MDGNVRLDGREFLGVAQSLSAAQDDYILAHLRLSGALEVLGGIALPENFTPEKRAEEMLTRILVSGRKEFILAGCLTEQGKTWSRAEADRNAARFAAITDREDKAAMQSSIVGFVVGFFPFGEPSPASSPKSSSPSATDRPIENEAAETSASSGPSYAK